jgi:general secretion pathway protein I
MLLSRGLARRPGLSLLEVLVALAIFLLAIGALWHLVGQATFNAERAHHQAQAARIAQSKLHLVMAGRYPLSGVESQSADDDDPGIDDGDDLKNYTWSLVVNEDGSSADGEHQFAANVYAVEVHVSRVLSDGETLEVVLYQVIADPTQTATIFDGLLPQSSTNTPSLGYTIPGGPTGNVTSGSSSGTGSSSGGN